MKPEMTEPKIQKIHRKCYRATFKMKLSGEKWMDVEYDATTKERLEHKIKYLKETGVFLRD